VLPPPALSSPLPFSHGIPAGFEVTQGRKEETEREREKDFDIFEAFGFFALMEGSRKVR